MQCRGPRDACLIAAPSRGHCWPRALVYVAGVLALLVSAISPADDSVQSDFSRYLRNGQYIVAASELLQPSRVLRPVLSRARVTTGDHAGPVRHPEDLFASGLRAPRLSSPAFEHSLAERAPPHSHSA